MFIYPPFLPADGSLARGGYGCTAGFGSGPNHARVGRGKLHQNDAGSNFSLYTKNERETDPTHSFVFAVMPKCDSPCFYVFLQKYDRKKVTLRSRKGKKADCVEKSGSSASKYNFLFFALALIIIARRKNAWN